MKRKNPFSYSSLEFIGREKELSLLNESINRGQSVVLYAPLGEGKTTLFNKCCSKYKYSKKYVIMRCDLMGTNNMSDFIECLIKSMQIHTTGTTLNTFISFLKSITPVISIDSSTGTPVFNIEISPDASETTLEKIKNYIKSSSKQYLLYIDEFQQIVHYPDNNAEALLQSFFSSLPNLVCVLSGSQNRIVKEILSTKMSSFYSSLTIIELSSIDCQEYTRFVVEQFKTNNVTVNNEIVESVYDLLEGSTLYMQRLFSNLYSKVDSGSAITSEIVDTEINDILSEKELTYKYDFIKCSPRQKEYLIKLAHGIQPTGRAYARPQSKFINDEKVSCKDQKYYINDKFFRVWLRKRSPLDNEESACNNQECGVGAQNPISKEDRNHLVISLAYLTALEWSRSNEKALLLQLKEILTSSIVCPNSPRFETIKKYLIDREEASLDSKMADEIKQYINDIKS